ncbi:hypothetical protein L7F22_000708 [Adiantum nelumboides]|nr:hypothetical protein [Adiantum nelumboides]
MTISRPDLSYAVGLVSQFMQLPRKPHLDAVRHMMRYVRATLDYAFFYDAGAQVQVHGCTDFDWVGSVFDCRSTSDGYILSFGSDAVTWCSKKQPTIALSSTEVQRVQQLQLVRPIHIERFLSMEGVASGLLSRASPLSSRRDLCLQASSSTTVCRASNCRTKGLHLRTDFTCSYLTGGLHGSFSGTSLCTARDSIDQAISRCSSRKGIITMVIPFQRGDARQQPPPDLPSYLFKNRIVFLGMSLVPSVTELIMAELLYLQYEDPEKPVYMYINSTGTTKDGEKLGYETEAFAIYDTMRYVKPPIFTLCVGNAWGEAALLLSAGAKGNRTALPSSTIMIKQPIAQFRGQATDIDIARKEVRNVKNELVALYARHTGHSKEKIEEDIRRPKYFSPPEAVDYGLIDKVLYSEKGQEKGVVADLKRSQLI